jgi:hypothetical protein
MATAEAFHGNAHRLYAMHPPGLAVPWHHNKALHANQRLSSLSLSPSVAKPILKDNRFLL